MSCSTPSLLSETVFYSSRGQHVTVPSSWFGGPAALGLSRAVMDDVLLRRAQQCGVNVLEGATIHEPIISQNKVLGVRLKLDGQEHEYHAPLTIDATGRARILTRKLHTEERRSKPKLIAFKVHLRNTRVAPNACEIYFYPGGYGGLSTIEGEPQQSLFHRLRGTGQASPLGSRNRDARSGDEEPARRAHPRARAIRIRMAERFVGTFRSTAPKPGEGFAGDRRFSSVYRSVHRQRNVDGF